MIQYECPRCGTEIAGSAFLTTCPDCGGRLERTDRVDADASRDGPTTG